jgi:hypothetical protein
LLKGVIIIIQPNPTKSLTRPCIPCNNQPQPKIDCREAAQILGDPDTSCLEPRGVCVHYKVTVQIFPPRDWRTEVT